MNICSLERALGENDILLVDSSAYVSPNPTRDRFSFSKFGNFGLIPPNFPLEMIDEFSSLSAIIGTPRARTIPEVTEEIDTLLHGITDGYNYLSRHNYSQENKRVRDEVKKGSDEELKQRLRNRELFYLTSRGNSGNISVLIRKIHTCVDLLRRREIRIADPAYERLVDMIKLVDRASGIKKRTRKLMTDPNYDMHNVDLPDTDERLVATAYWISMLSETRVGVIAKDNDFFGLLGVTPKVLGTNEFNLYNELVRRKLRKNPVRFYFIRDDLNCEKMSTRDVEIPKYFALFHATKENSKYCRDQIFNFWKEFYEYRRRTGIKYLG